jgi:5-methylcytosine-specific restriction endonuclease McrA
MISGSGRRANARQTLTTNLPVMEVRQMAAKKCSRCGQFKPRSEFTSHKQSKDGLQPACKPCCGKAKRAAYWADPEKARQRQRDYYNKNLDAVKASNKKSREKNREKLLEGKKAWYESVKDTPEFKAKQAAYIEATKERKRQYDKEYRRRPEVADRLLSRAKRWAKNNPEKRAAVVRNYRDKRRAQEESGVSTAELAEWTQRQKKVCYWCGGKCAEDFHVDHYVPLSKGGPHELENLVIACAPCNLRKNAKDPLEFAQEVGRLF